MYNIYMMNYWYGNNFGYGMMSPFFSFMPFILPLVLLELVLKGFALWKAARNNELYWFIAILVLNTFGILPAVYLLLHRNKK